MGETERLADYANLVLVKKLDRLNKLKLKVLGKTAHIVVRLNCLFALSLLYALENIGVDSALSEELHALKLARLVGEHLDKLLTDYLSLGLGVGYARKKVEETVGSINVYKISVKLIFENFYYVF